MDHQETPTILVVDDDVHVLITLKTIIKEFDMNPLVAENVPEALKLLKQQSVDLILTDMIMPDIDGLEFIDIVRNAYPGIPIAVISAYGVIANTVSALSKGAYNFISKPFSLDSIKTVIEKGLRLRNLSLNTDILLDYVSTKSVMTFPNDQELFSAVNYFLLKECQWRGIESDVTLMNISICLEEALMNAYTHGNLKDPQKKVHLEAVFTQGTFEVTITDEGEGFDHKTELESITMLKPQDITKKGLFILKSIAETLDFSDKGNSTIFSFSF